MKGFAAKDIYRHRVPGSLDGATGHRRVVLQLSRAVKSEDGYERTLWGLDAGDEAPRQLTTAVFAASSPRWNADASTLAFLSDRGAGRQVQLLSMAGGEARNLTDSKLALDAIEGWASDGRALLVSALVEVNEDGEPGSTPNGKRPPQVARFLPYKRDGAGIIVGTRAHLCSVSLEDGEVVQLTRGDFEVKSGRWSPDGRRLAYVRARGGRQRHRTDVWLADADGGDARLLCDRLASVGSIAWSPDGRWLALSAGEQEGDSMVQAWLLDVASGELRLLGGGDFELEPAAPPVWHADAERLAVVGVRGSLQHIAVLDLDGGAPRYLHGGLRHVKGLCAFGERLAFIVASMRKPEELHSIGWDGESERRHSRFNRGWFARRARPRVSLRRIEVADGDGVRDRVEAWLLLPPGCEGPYPLLVDMHGGPHSTVLVDYSAHTYWYELLSKGWAILAPNAVGSGGFGKQFARRLRGRWGELDLPQYDALVGHLQREGIADQRVVCAGKSYGGFLGAWAAAHSELYRAAIVAAPVANVTSHFGTSDTGYYVTPYAMDGEVHQARERYVAQSPITHCHATRTAVLILQGENDGRCPRGQSEELFANLIRCTEAPVELVVYPESTHAEAESGRPGNRVDYHARVAAWAERWADGSVPAKGQEAQA